MRVSLCLPCYAMAVAMLATAAGAGPTRIVFIAGEPSHGYGAHEFNAGATLLAEVLRKSELDLEVEVHRNGWPDQTAAEPLRGADALVLYMDGGSFHPVLEHLEEVDAFVRRGGGLFVMHYALEVPTGDAANAMTRWIGGTYEDRYSTNPVWRAALRVETDHPASAGVAPFAAEDEWYFNLRFGAQTSGLRPLLTAVPDDHARENPTWPRTPHDDVLAARGRREVLAWTLSRPDGGRGAGFSGGHFHWNWGNDAYRTLVLNTIVWVAGAEVPAGGVPPATVDFERLRTDQDEHEPWFFFDAVATRGRFGLEERSR